MFVVDFQRVRCGWGITPHLPYRVNTIALFKALRTFNFYFCGNRTVRGSVAILFFRSCGTVRCGFLLLLFSYGAVQLCFKRQNRTVQCGSAKPHRFVPHRNKKVSSCGKREKKIVIITLVAQEYSCTTQLAKLN